MDRRRTWKQITGVAWPKAAMAIRAVRRGSDPPAVSDVPVVRAWQMAPGRHAWSQSIRRMRLTCSSCQSRCPCCALRRNPGYSAALPARRGDRMDAGRRGLRRSVRRV